MAKKHFDAYFQEIYEQYHELNSELKDLAEAVEKKLISPEQMEDIKKNVIEPVKQNYMTLSFVMYLLNIPERAKKRQKYDRMMTKFKEHCIEENKLQEENKEHLKELKNFIDN